MRVQLNPLPRKICFALIDTIESKYRYYIYLTRKKMNPDLAYRMKEDISSKEDNFEELIKNRLDLASGGEFGETVERNRGEHSNTIQGLLNFSADKDIGR